MNFTGLESFPNTLFLETDSAGCRGGPKTQARPIIASYPSGDSDWCKRQAHDPSRANQSPSMGLVRGPGRRKLLLHLSL